MVQAQANDWREKYLDLVELQESQQHDFDDQLEQLRRALVRVSLAADGVDPELDRVLAALREHLKSPEKHNQLYKRLAVVEEALIAFDERKVERLNRLHQAVESLLDQLKTVSSDRATSKQCKTLASGLKIRLSNQQELPAVLQEVAQLQTKIFAGDENQKTGILQKFLSGRDKSPPQEKEPAQVSAESTSSCLDPETVAILTELLDLTEGDQAGISKLLQRLQGDCQVSELPAILKTLRGLLAETIVRAKTEFSEFLQQTNTQLHDISQILSHASKLAKQHNEQQHELYAAMGDQLENLQTTVAEASNLDQLKHEVSSQLQHIRDRIAQAEKKPLSLSAQLKDLLGKVEQFEQEAQNTSQKLNQQRYKAETDSLTGLPNREAYEQRLQMELARWQRYNNPLSLAVLDIDHFKKINDTYGHQAGDRVLKLIAQTLRRSLRSTDFIGRYGGEEFVVLLPETDREQADVVLNKIRTTVAKTPFHFRKQPVQITLSIGYSEFKDTDSDAVVFSRADKALYQAKNNGRNCCQVAH